MMYHDIKEGSFVSRPNRFIADVMVDGRTERVHVKNTGRCAELLLPGSRVYLSDSQNLLRKTRYDLVAAEKETERGKMIVNLDSQAPNAAAAEWLPKSGLFAKNAVFRREVKKGDSRFDFSIEEKGRLSYLEVKGVTLEKNGLALFPDAPTERGVKHLHELINCVKAGYGAYVFFVIQMKGVSAFSPNCDTHPAFAGALKKAKKAGVTLLAYDCKVTSDSMSIDQPIPILL